MNAVGRTIRELKRLPDEPGNTLRLSLDVHLQRFAAGLFGKETGAAVVMDAWSGEVLTMASIPTFDPAAFTEGIGADDWAALVSAPNAPLVNKAVALPLLPRHFWQKTR